MCCYLHPRAKCLPEPPAESASFYASLSSISFTLNSGGTTQIFNNNSKNVQPFILFIENLVGDQAILGRFRLFHFTHMIRIFPIPNQNCLIVKSNQYFRVSLRMGFILFYIIKSLCRIFISKSLPNMQFQVTFFYIFKKNITEFKVKFQVRVLNS